MNWFKETGLLIKWLFVGNPQNQDDLEINTFKYYPFKGYSAMSWCGHLICKKKPAITTILHENIHLYQAKKFRWWIGYYVSYLWQWCLGNPFFKSAYYTNPYEMQAYANEWNIDYLTNWNPDNIKKYIIKHRRKTWKEHGNNIYAWKIFLGTLK